MAGTIHPFHIRCIEERKNPSGRKKSMNIEDKELEQFRKSQRRKDIIKNITIVFFLIFLALTFFSRTIMNYTLPQVATHVVAQGEVAPRIRGQGTAEVDDPYNVMMTQSRQIKSVAVRVDQKVKRGDVLYYLEDNESEDLRTARQELSTLQSDYTKKLFDGTLSDADITRLRAGNYRSDDQMQAELASANRRLDSATAEAAAAKAALDKLAAENSGSSGDSGVTPTSTDSAVTTSSNKNTPDRYKVSVKNRAPKTRG